jgi:hypothetical protein
MLSLCQQSFSASAAQSANIPYHSRQRSSIHTSSNSSLVNGADSSHGLQDNQNYLNLQDTTEPVVYEQERSIQGLLQEPFSQEEIPAD